jgi:acetyl esterase/lipase
VDYDRAYANGLFTPCAEAFPPRWARDAAAFRATLGQRARTAIPYGPKLRNHLDLFLPEAAPQGLLVFVHGGYWLEFDRETWSHLAAGAVARGWACAVPSYTLAPEARIGAMTQEIASAIRVAASLIAGPVVVTGHSAGGHLSARMACVDLALSAIVRRVVPISPLADLEPISLTGMNVDLRLDPAEIVAESPARLSVRPGVEAHVWVGAQERPAFLWQARLLSEAWACPWTPESGKNHFDVIDGLSDPASALMSACLGANRRST